MYSPIPDLPLDEPATLSSSEQKRLGVRRGLWCGFLAIFAVSCILFGTYMTCFYLRSMVQHHLDAWDRVNPHMYHKDRWDSNYFGLGLHFVGAAYAMLLGPLQFVPWIRRHYISWHRWNGRLTALSLTLTALGGLYYVCAVGVTSVTIEGQQANWTTSIFGLFMLVSGVQLYRHAAWTKQIDQHKLWAYRVAGLCFGNIFARIYLLVMYLVLGNVSGRDGEQLENSRALQVATTVLGYTFFFPFWLLGGEVWRREQQGNKWVPSVFFLIAMSLLLVLFAFGVVLVFLFFWLPFITVGNLEQEEAQGDL